VRKIMLLSTLVVVAFASGAAAQTFEVASVKTAGPLDPQKILSGQQRVGMKVAGSNVDIESMALPELLYLAFKVRPSQLTGPSWLKPSDAMAMMSAPRFDIHAKLPAGGSEAQVPAMLQALLVDRFKLTFHRESKEQNVYALVVGKGGSKLEPSAPDEPPAPGAPPASARPDPIQVSGNPQTGMTIKGSGSAGPTRIQMGQDGMMHMSADKLTVEELATSIQGFVDRPVVDQTGLQGKYKITLDLSMADMMAAARAAGANIPAGFGAPGAPASGPADPSGASIFQSVEKMGLKLEPRKSAVEYFVIDTLEKTPTED
jgi:uncharacterized protein (TIGR03435 family)